MAPQQGKGHVKASLNSKCPEPLPVPPELVFGLSGEAAEAVDKQAGQAGTQRHVVSK